MRTRELDELKCKSFSNMRLVGMVRRHCQSLSGQYLVFGVRREVSNCQIQVFDINKQVGSVWWSLLLHQNWIFQITSSSQERGGHSIAWWRWGILMARLYNDFIPPPSLHQTVTFELNLFDAIMDLSAFAVTVGSIIPISYVWSCNNGFWGKKRWRLQPTLKCHWSCGMA